MKPQIKNKFEAEKNKTYNDAIINNQKQLTNIIKQIRNTPIENQPKIIHKYKQTT